MHIRGSSDPDVRRSFSPSLYVLIHGNPYFRSDRTAPPTLQSDHPTILLSTCEHHCHCQKAVNINMSFDISVCVLTCSEDWRLSHALAMPYMCARPLCHRCISVPSCTCSSPPPLFSPQCNHTVPDAMLCIASAAQHACRAPTVTHMRYQAIRGRLGDVSPRLHPGHEWWNEMRDAGVDVKVAPTADRYISDEGTTTEPGPGGSWWRSRRTM